MMMATTRSVDYGNRRIIFELRRAETQRLRITIAPDGAVSVRAPTYASDETVDSRVVRRGRWIIRQQDEIADLRRLRRPKRFVSGETHRYLGRQYRLSVRPAVRPSVKLKGGYYEVRISAPRDSDLVQRHIECWFRQQSERVFSTILEEWLKDSSFRNLAKPRLTIRTMKNRWGSCTAGGHILLNPMLIHVPRPCIEYVVVHELCHLVHHHHGPEFYKLLDRVLPDWKSLKLRLNTCEL